MGDCRCLRHVLWVQATLVEVEGSREGRCHNWAMDSTFTLGPPFPSNAPGAHGFKGQVSFIARAAGQHITFPKVTAKAPWPNVMSIEMESTHSNAEEIAGTVYVTDVASEAEGMDIAAAAIEDALNRLVFAHGVSIETPEVTGSRFEPVNPVPSPGLNIGALSGYLRIKGGSVRAIRGLQAADIRSTLEAAAPPGERHYWRYRSSRASSTHVEEFMHLYSMLLELVGEKQERVDAFIRQVEPGVAMSISCHTGKPETIYTRLRNEVGHRRPGTTIQSTRAEMVANIGGLREIVRAAIKAFP